MSHTSIGKACLFGGALTAAGLGAHAQPEFIIGQSTHDVGTTPGPIAAGYAGGGDYAQTIDIGAPFGATTAEATFATGTSARVSLGASEISGVVEKSIASFGYIAFETSFSVTEDTDVLVSWDVATDVPTVDRRFRVWRSMGPTLFEYDEFDGPHAGSETISLLAGEQYFVDVLYRSIWQNGPGAVRLEFASDADRLCADQNNDGLVTPADFNSWILNFNQNDLVADTNQDGVLSPADFNAWILAFNEGVAGPVCDP